MQDHLEDLQEVIDKDKLRIDEHGVGAIEKMFKLKQELVKKESYGEDEFAVDFLGNPLPLTLSQVVRTKAVVDEVGLVNILSSGMKIRVAAGGRRPMDRLKGMSLLVILPMYVGIAVTLAVLKSNSAVYDQGEGACLESEAVTLMLETGVNATTSRDEAAIICEGLKDRNTILIAIAKWGQISLAVSTLFLAFLLANDFTAILSRSKGDDPDVIGALKRLV